MKSFYALSALCLTFCSVAYANPIVIIGPVDRITARPDVGAPRFTPRPHPKRQELEIEPDGSRRTIRCGGRGWTNPRRCPDNYVCVRFSERSATCQRRTITLTSVSRSTVRPTGTVSRSTVYPTGTVSRTTVRPTGTVSRSTVYPTGTVSRTTVRPTGTVSRSTVRPTGTVSRTTANPTGTVSRSTVLPTSAPTAPKVTVTVTKTATVTRTTVVPP